MQDKVRYSAGSIVVGVATKLSREEMHNIHNLTDA